MSKEKPKSTWKQVVKYYWMQAKKYKILLFSTYVAYSVATVFDNVVVPYFYRNVIDAITGYTAATNGGTGVVVSGVIQSQIMGYVGVIVIVLLITRICYSIGDYTMSYYQVKALRDVSDFAFSKMINHSYQFFVNSFAGGLVKKVGRFVNGFEDINDVFMYGIWLQFIRLISVFIVLFIIAPFIGWLFLVWAIIFIAMSYYLALKRVQFDTIESSADSRTTGRTADVFTNVLNLKMFSSAGREKISFNTVVKEQMDAKITAWNFQNFTYALQGFVVTWLGITSLYVSITLWFDGLITLGTVVLTYSYSNTIFDSVWNLGKQMSRLSKISSNAAEMVDIIDEPIEIRDPENPETLEIKNGEIVFNDVEFSYNQGVKILENYNLSIKAGERVGVIGTSGAGKTTITKLLLRFADVKGGAILIDGQDIRNITQDDLRSVVSYVPQDPILFHRTLAENIAYGRPGATMDEIITAATQAHAHEFIKSLSHGYDTLVGERGVKLSGGERQRVAIARAILKNAPILILDEATSSLDSVSETHIKEALDILMSGKTTIVIAHRLSTIEKMDRIIVMEKGRIVEEGNHDELSRKGGIYKNFWDHQYGGFIK
jgi:ATP-binding cassette, subfamily B, bacterial